MEITHMDVNLPTLHRLEQSLKNAATKSREKVLHTFFDAFISPSPDPHLSFAVPKIGLESLPNISVLKDTFRQRSRTARLEYFHELYPDLKDCLLQAGFELEMSAPVMTLVPEDLSPATTLEFNCKVLTHDKEMLTSFLRAQNISFGGTGEEVLTWLPSMLELLAQGELIGAVMTQDGEFVSGAVVQGAEDGELAGVWTLPEYRRQGLSFALCQRLLTEYFAKGQSLCWLSAAEGALRLYEKLGFRRVGTQLNFRAD
jgi:ribosomal protein S18 acetylase RimI-like enzyme